LQRQHHAGEQRRQSDNRQREIADVDDLPQDQARVVGRGEAGDEGAAGEQHKPSGAFEKRQEGGADRREKADHSGGLAGGASR
jgi:hypothetical protein